MTNNQKNMYIETVLLFNKKTWKGADSSPSPGSADVLVGRYERIDSNPVPRQKIRSVRRSAPRPGSAPPATGAALPTGWVFLGRVSSDRGRGVLTEEKLKVESGKLTNGVVIFSHAEVRRARREEDWIFSACSAAPREPRVCLLKKTFGETFGAATGVSDPRLQKKAEIRKTNQRSRLFLLSAFPISAFGFPHSLFQIFFKAADGGGDGSFDGGPVIAPQ
jgi:hypothetical protein